MPNTKLMVTLWPSFPHFPRFAEDGRLSGIRLNSAKIEAVDLDRELALLRKLPVSVPLYFDIKGRQLRITHVYPNSNYLDMVINHPISVITPTPVLFKAGADHALLEKVVEGGRRLIFRGGPQFTVEAGDSFHIRHPSLQIFGQQFVNSELEKIAKVREFGFKRYFLSYVQSKRDVDEFLELVGRDCQIMLKIEDKKGLNYVAKEFVKQPNLTLVVARGDMYVEIDKPHEILGAQRFMLEKDPEALVGSRILLSVVDIPRLVLEDFLKALDARKINPGKAGDILFSILGATVPSCADFSELAWLHSIGYRNFMLCDELCLKEELLSSAINAFESWKLAYAKGSEIPIIKPMAPSKSRGFFRQLGLFKNS